MSLDRYKAKRNFRKTPEPFGRDGRHNGRLHFVVQKHDASHLHYDFRLENHGVLKSWAVPKGPSTDPHVRRLAMEVEDHPIEYQDFEGIIPQGNYGAGTVMVWDNGEYFVDPNLSRAENDRLIKEQLRKGHLTFYLNGKKLKGKYTLVKLHGRAKNEWLLIKKQDDFANISIPDADASVQTGRTLEEIAEQKKSKVWQSNKKKKGWDLEGAVRTSLPERVSPMLATLVKEAFDRPDWIFEVKWDGYRMLAQYNGAAVRLYSRNNKDYTQTFPELAGALTGLGAPAVLDGELVVLDERGVSAFQLLQNYMHTRKGHLVYYAFDLLYWNGYDLRGLPLKRRREILRNVLPASDYIRFSDHMEQQGKAFYKAAKENGLEGVIGKNSDSTYQTGRRSQDWIKVKAVQEQEAVICGFTRPRGSRKFLGALILGVYKDGQLVYVGHTGGGFDEDMLKQMHGLLRPLQTRQCPFKTKPKTNAPVTWVKPQILCEVKFQEWTQGGHMRQPIFLGLRQDKRPKDVEAEVPMQKPKPMPKQSLAVDVTHEDKVFWPKEGYTKGDVVKYYQAIAPFILPYLKDRPQSLRRQPNGIADKGFFHKNITFELPAGIKTVEVAAAHEKSHALICNDAKTLAYMNNLGCIEINPWSSTYQKPQHPDYMVLDFDPVNIGLDRVIDAVLTARDILRKARMVGWCKTSGSRGMHVYIPLKKKYTYGQVKDFALLLCSVIHEKLPGITSLERSPGKRKGLIYLDYLQNHYTATMAAPYSLRPRPAAPVSTPLEWKEVKRTLVIEDFNIKTTPVRLKRKGDLWKGVLGKGIDMAASLKILEKL